jgi:uncharacterized protein
LKRVAGQVSETQTRSLDGRVKPGHDGGSRGQLAARRRSWPRLALALIAFVALAFGALAAPNFPALSGRVVDQAGVMTPEQRAGLEGRLKTLEDKSGIQLVVATVSSLDGEEIEPYANALARAWKLGEAQKNNGVLFLIAPNQHRVRIEVGYGLEGTLTDATSKIIIVNAVTPRFKAGDFYGGISRGVDDIIAVLTTDSSDWQKRPTLRSENAPVLLMVFGIFLFVAIFIIVIMILVRRGNRGGGMFLPTIIGSGGGFSGGGGGGFSGGGGGFSGGGGSFGGGGASGSW